MFTMNETYDKFCEKEIVLFTHSCVEFLFQQYFNMHYKLINTIIIIKYIFYRITYETFEIPKILEIMVFL